MRRGIGRPAPRATGGQTGHGCCFVGQRRAARSGRAPRLMGRRSGHRPVTARSLAYRALLRIDHDGAFANLLLPTLLSRSSLRDQDRRFATDLVYGTTRMRRACDALVDRFVVEPPDPATRTLLRLGAYQLGFGGVPAHAAVSETVGLAPRRVRGFVNAVLRKVAGTEMVWPSEASRLSYPDW